MRFNKYFLYGGLVAVIIIGVLVYKTYDKSTGYSDKLKASLPSKGPDTPQTGNLNDEPSYSEICDMDLEEYEKLLGIANNNDTMGSKLKESVEILEFPTLIRKNDDTKYVKFAFKPKMNNTTIYGFWRNGANDVELSFKLAVTKLPTKKYRLQINKRIVQVFSSIKMIEIELRDTNQLKFTINDSTSIPLYINNLQYFAIDSDHTVKYKEDEKKPQ